VFDVTVITLAVATTLDVMSSCVPLMKTFAPVAAILAVNVVLEATLTAAPVNTVLEMISRLAAVLVVPPRRAVSAISVLAAKLPYNLALR
jgi:hypothetical protein